MSLVFHLIFIFGLVYFTQVINSEQNSSNKSTQKNQVIPVLKAIKNGIKEEDARNQSETLMAQPQHFVPVTHFHNGPFAQHFQPVNVNNGLRNFRPVPQLFMNSGLTYLEGIRGVRNNRFFHETQNRGFNQLANSMQFRPIQHMRPLVPINNRPILHQRPFFNQEAVNSNSQFHNNYHVIDEQSETASQDLLGSGNFNIIRGGIFADPENPPLHYRQHHRPTTNSDFFEGFKDFQPFSNALTVTHYRNAMQNLPSKINTVTINKIKSSQKIKVKPIKISIEKTIVDKINH